MLWLCVYLLIFAMGEAASNEQRQRRHQKHWPAQNLIADFEVAVKRPPIQQQRHPQLFVAYVIENDDMLVKKVCQCTAKKIIVHFLAGQKNDIVKLSRNQCGWPRMGCLVVQQQQQQQNDINLDDY